jgi:hypothetical protein
MTSGYLYLAYNWCYFILGSQNYLILFNDQLSYQYIGDLHAFQNLTVCSQMHNDINCYKQKEWDGASTNSDYYIERKVQNVCFKDRCPEFNKITSNQSIDSLIECIEPHAHNFVQNKRNHLRLQYLLGSLYL